MFPARWQCPVGGLALSIGPGFSVEGGHAHFLVRFGVGWDFELPGGTDPGSGSEL